jgi:hypothetical protein
VSASGVDVLGAVGQFNDRDFSAASFRQLQPVLPQRPLDVQPDVTYFVNGVSREAQGVRVDGFVHNRYNLRFQAAWSH